MAVGKAEGIAHGADATGQCLEAVAIPPSAVAITVARRRAEVANVNGVQVWEVAKGLGKHVFETAAFHQMDLVGLGKIGLVEEGCVIDLAIGTLGLHAADGRLAQAVSGDDDMFEDAGQGWVLGDVDQGLEAVGEDHELLLAEELVREEVEEGLLERPARQAHIAQVGCREEGRDAQQNLDGDVCQRARGRLGLLGVCRERHGAVPSCRRDGGQDGGIFGAEVGWDN